ncbi:MAG: ABC transporter ATP-binding protein [Verrucomicrobiota bacterium]
MQLYRRILAYYKPFSGAIVVATILMLMAIGLNLLKPWPMKFVVDNILAVHGAEAYRLPFLPFEVSFVTALFITCGSLVGIHLLWGAFNLVNTYWLIDIGLRALLRLRTELYAYLQSLPLRFHDDRRSADSTFRVAYDSQAIQTFFNRGFATILSAAVTLAGAFIIMAQMNLKLTLISLAVTPFLLIAIGYYAKKIRTQSATLQAEESDVLSRASEGLSSIRVVHAFGREEHEVSIFERECRDSLRANLRLNITNVISTLIVGIIVAAGTSVLLYFGAMEVAAAKMTLGELLVFLAYLTMLYQPLEQLSYTAWAMEGAAAGVARSFEILDAKNDVPDSPRAKKFHPAEGKIELRDIHFAYQTEQPILRGIDLIIQPGETVALVGATGAGKTTILSLVPRFYDPTQGKILIDAQNIRDVTKKSLRQNISMVLQDTLLFNATIRENIAYGKENASQKDIEVATRAAQAEDFILAMPQGYDTPVGERGVKLSGGQRQRIGIARAFLKNSPILLLDEPTSALDLETEAEIMHTLKKLMQKPTTLIVTHRLQTVHDLGKIVVLENGRIMESGTGAQLLEKHGVYYKLWNASKADA